jgi:DNA polymerase-3 subunit epsilon
MDLLAVDCQSTGASPSHGHLLEVAWTVTRADDDTSAEPTSYVVALPPDDELPRRIQRMTGISDAELENAASLSDVWDQLSGDASALGDGPTARAAIHYARFEKAFLRDAHERLTPNAPFPLDIICTHAIAQRLFPELPRRGLRALAGFLGHTVPEQKRAAHHVEATAAIWRQTVRELDIEWGVTTLDELQAWLETREPKWRGGKRYALPRETRLALPDVPGVYRMLSKSGEVLYVGKATSLKSRVNSYFQTRRGLSNTKLELVTQIWDVDVTECETPLEAAMLETDEIKRHSPSYNSALRRRDRQLYWTNRDWNSFRTRPDTRHPVGPLTDPTRLALLGALRRNRLDDVPDESLRYLGESRELLADGVAHLRDEYGVDLTAPNAQVRRFALERWRIRHEQKLAEARADDDELDETDETDVAEREWTPELVAEQLERTIRWSYRSLRLARWLALLGHSTVRWSGPNGQTNRLILANGRPADARREGAGVDWDVPTWDRLRVLTTELRRLVASDADPSVELHGCRTLAADQLARLFRWV